MAALELPQRYRQELLSILRGHVPQAEVWAYGSRVSGLAHDACDLDLVLRNPANPGLPLSGLAGLREALSESRLPILVDVQDWARIPAAFRREIEQAHVVVFAQPDQAQTG